MSAGHSVLGSCFVSRAPTAPTALGARGQQAQKSDSKESFLVPPIFLLRRWGRGQFVGVVAGAGKEEPSTPLSVRKSAVWSDAMIKSCATRLLQGDNLSRRHDTALSRQCPRGLNAIIAYCYTVFRDLRDDGGTKVPPGYGTLRSYLGNLGSPPLRPCKKFRVLNNLLRAPKQKNRSLENPGLPLWARFVSYSIHATLHTRGKRKLVHFRSFLQALSRVLRACGTRNALIFSLLGESLCSE